MSTLRMIADGRPRLADAPAPAKGPRLWSDGGAVPAATLARAVAATQTIAPPAADAVDFVPQGPLTQAEQCDVLIIGGGISGAFVAQQLATAGVDVVLVDRAAPATGSTGLSTALIQYEPDVPLVELIPMLGLADAQAVYRQTRAALDDLHRLVEERRIDCDLHQRSSLYLARNADDVPHLQHESFAREQIGLAAPYVDERTLRGFHGIDRPGALRTPIAYELDPRKLTLGLLADAAAQGARIYDHTSVSADPWVGGLPALRTSDGQSIHCDHVVYATGYAAVEQFPALRPLNELRTTFAAVVRPRADESAKWWLDQDRPMLWELGDAYFYARSDGADRLIIGGGDVPKLTPDSIAAVLPAKTEQLLRDLERTTGIQDVQVERTYGATFAQTPDGLPFIGSPDCSDRCFFALGYGGNGILFSLLAGQIIRDQLLSRSHPAERLFGFSRRPARQRANPIHIGSCP